MISFSWFSPAAARTRIGMPAAYIRSMFQATHNRLTMRYSLVSPI